MSPLFVHDPRRGSSLPERFSLDGNPDPDTLWTTSTLEYLDADGKVQLLTTPLTPAEFALGEVRFGKQFRALKAAEEANGVPIAEYVELSGENRVGKVPFVYATDANRHLIKVACSAAVVALVEDRKRHWLTLQFLSGRAQATLDSAHRAELAALQARYDEATAARETSLDEIAAAMAELASSSSATPVAFGGAAFGGGGGGAAAAPAAAAPATATAVADRPIWLDEADVPLCNDCGTCYQELPAMFEKATIVVDGEARTVGRMKPGALDGLVVTPELSQRFARVKATCDAEIIR